MGQLRTNPVTAKVRNTKPTSWANLGAATCSISVSDTSFQETTEKEKQHRCVLGDRKAPSEVYPQETCQQCHRRGNVKRAEVCESDSSGEKNMRAAGKPHRLFHNIPCGG